jgi:uncharacterized repeat protein (TIGR02543 family)
VCNKTNFNKVVVGDYGSTYTVPTPPARQGFTFTGWWTQESGGTKVFDGGATVTHDANSQTLYSQWKANQYTDKFVCNKTGFNKTITGDYGSTYAAPSPTAVTGFTFAGWWTQESGGTKVCDAGEIITHDAKNDTFYAQWSANPYTDTFDPNGGIGGGTFTGTYLSTYNAPSATRQGYAFTGWWSAPNGGSKLADAGVTMTHNTTNDVFYAQWDINQYTISYNANGGSNAPSSQTKIYGSALTLSYDEPTRDGYLFQGWATTPDGMVLYQAGSSYAEDTSVTLYAIWKGANLVTKLSRACIKHAGSDNTCRVIIRHDGAESKCKIMINHNDAKLHK